MRILNFPWRVKRSITTLLLERGFPLKVFPTQTLSVYNNYWRLEAEQPGRLVVTPLPQSFVCFLCVSFKTKQSKIPNAGARFANSVQKWLRGNLL